MNWITRLIEAPKSILRGHKEDKAPEGLWLQCSGCQETLYSKELKRNAMVCPKCEHHQRISAQERAEQLFDQGSWVAHDQNLSADDPLHFSDLKRYKDRLKDAKRRASAEDSVRNYTGRIQELEISASIFDFAYMGGSMGSVAGEKIVRGMERAVAQQIPYLLVASSGGARMQEGMFSLLQMAKTSASVNQLHAQGIPFVCLLTDPTMGGVSASVAWLGDVIIAEPGALIGFAGPRVIQETVGETLPEGFQRSEFLLQHGLIDAVVDRRELRDYLHTLYSHLGQQSYSPAA